MLKIAFAASCAAAMLAASIAGTSASPLTRPAGSGACSPSRPHAAGTTPETIATADGQRAYRLHVPATYDGVAAVPLVLNIHGARSSASAQEIYSGFSAKSDLEGFVVVYPEGVVTTAIPYTHFNAWLLPSPEPDDVGFMNTLLDAVEAQLCIDTNRVYSTGISNGAMLSTRLACSVSSRIAAIGPVAGAYYPPDFVALPEACPDTRPVPMMAFHGTADTIVPFNGGLGGISGTNNYRLPIDNNTVAEDVLADWAAHNGCTLPRQESQVDTEVRLIRYDSCLGNAVVELYAVDGGGHTWPGAFDVPSLGYTTHQITATDLIWAFFSAQSLSPPSSVGGIAEAPEASPVLAASGSPDRRGDPVYWFGGAALAVTLVAGVLWRRRRL